MQLQLTNYYDPIQVDRAIILPVRLSGHEAELMRWGILRQRLWQLTASKHIQPPIYTNQNRVSVGMPNGRNAERRRAECRKEMNIGKPTVRQ